MQIEQDIPTPNPPKKLKDFIPLVLTFFVALLVLSLYQNLSLFTSGVLDTVFSKSILALWVNHIGFVAITALILSFVFKFFENKKSGLGYTIIKVVLILLVIIEALLVQYYVNNYEILGTEIFSLSKSNSVLFSVFPLVGILILCVVISFYVHKITSRAYLLISRMYPFTILLFSLFLATLYADKKPINENKTNHLIKSIKNYALANDAYTGTLEYPLLKKNTPKDVLSPLFNTSTKKPHIVCIVVEGLGSDFVGSHPKFKGFTPFLQNLTEHSLFWENHLSNSGENFAALPNIVGSLPFGTEGFTNLEQYTQRNTLFGLLKKNGYKTSFYFGGNSAFNYLDKFLEEERVDRIIDKQDFGKEFTMQEEDAAGISIGYSDAALYTKYSTKRYTSNTPRFDVVCTQSTKNPYLIPTQNKYLKKVEHKLNTLPLEKRAKKLVSKNKELFASLLYADKEVQKFIEAYKNTTDYPNTIFIITGSHNNTDLPHSNGLQRYRVPLFIYSPLQKKPMKIASVSSHADIAPSILSYLHTNYAFSIPNASAWQGDGLIQKTTFNPSKEIPLIKSPNAIVDYIKGAHFLGKNKVYKLNNRLHLKEEENDSISKKIKQDFKLYKGINAYVTANNKILPDSLVLFTNRSLALSKQDKIWIESVFDGKNYDKAYITAKELAFKNDWDRSLLLCNHILSKIPRHSDTEILVGRLYAWKKDYTTAMALLEEAVRKYPNYEDAYSALLDVYFWANTSEKVRDLEEQMKEYHISSKKLSTQILRAKNQVLNNNQIADTPF